MDDCRKLVALCSSSKYLTRVIRAEESSTLKCPFTDLDSKTQQDCNCGLISPKRYAITVVSTQNGLFMFI